MSFLPYIVTQSERCCFGDVAKKKHGTIFLRKYIPLTRSLSKMDLYNSWNSRPHDQHR